MIYLTLIIIFLLKIAERVKLLQNNEEICRKWGDTTGIYEEDVLVKDFLNYSLYLSKPKCAYDLCICQHKTCRLVSHDCYIAEESLNVSKDLTETLHTTLPARKCQEPCSQHREHRGNHFESQPIDLGNDEKLPNYDSKENNFLETEENKRVTATLNNTNNHETTQLYQGYRLQSFHENRSNISRPKCTYDLCICQHKTCLRASFDQDINTNEPVPIPQSPMVLNVDSVTENISGDFNQSQNWDRDSDTDSQSDDSESDDDNEELPDDMNEGNRTPQISNSEDEIPGFNYIKCMYTNADGLLNKIEKMKLRVADCKPDVFAIVETHCQPDETSHKYCPDEVLQIEGYSLFRQDNSRERKGGILIYVLNTISATEDTTLKKLSVNFKEALWLNLEINKETVLFGAIYRKGSSTAQNNLLLRETIMNASKRFDKLLICGDLNHPEIDWLNNSVNAGPYSPPMRFLDCLNDSYLAQHVMEPTRARGTDEPSLLDLVITEDSQTQVHSSLNINDPLGKSDHAVLTWKYLISTNEIKDQTQTPQTEPPKSFNFKKADFAKMNDMLGEVDWKSLFEDLDLNESVEVFYKKVDDISRECIPLKKNLKRYNRPPWMTKKARKCIRKKKCAWDRYIKSPSYNKYTQYIKERNAACKKLRKAKKDFEKKLAKECKKNPKALFSYANFKNKVKQNVIRIKDCSGKLLVKDEDNANELNSYFQSVFTEEDDAPEIIYNQGINLLFDEETPPEPFEYQGKCAAKSLLENVEISEDEIINELKKIDPFKANTKDCINPRILKEVKDTIATPLKIIYNMSMDTGAVPSRWKNGIVTPLYKSGNKHQAKNYRPVTITSILCRTMERVLKRHILQHLKDNDILADEQHGFVSGRSCLSNLLMNLEELTTIYDSGDPIDEIFLDLQKAFDSVPHKRLLYKLEKAGITGELLEWINSFLSDRKQRVALNNSYSKWVDVKSGVPQGSVLGPILFIVFINDLPKQIKANCSIFADDTKVWKRIRCLEDADILQEDLYQLEEWTKVWKLKFNPLKSHVIHIGRTNQSYLYHLDNYLLPVVTTEKDLGVQISYDLKAAENVAYQVKKANKMLGIIRRTFSYINEESFNLLYKTYVRPHLEYGQQACYPYLSKDIDMVEKVQRRATKLVRSLENLSYEERMKKLKLYSLEDRRLRADMIAVHKITHGLTDINMSKLFTFAENSVTRGHSYRLTAPKCTKTEIRRNFFSQRTVVPWNKLKEEIVSSLTTEEFKRKYDLHMLKSKM